MDAVVRTVVIYAFVMLIFRIAGRRTLGELTSFDFVLLLIIGEGTQQALLGDDFSITNAMIVISTLVAIDIGLSMVKMRFPVAERVLDGVPMLLVENGRLLKDRMDSARLNEDDILEAAREKQGLEQLDQVKYAILEVSGGITIIPASTKPQTRKRTSRKKQAGKST